MCGIHSFEINSYANLEKLFKKFLQIRSHLLTIFFEIGKLEKFLKFSFGILVRPFFISN